MTPRVILSCEHALCRVPARYQHVFRGAERQLRSHRGSDPGALELARHLARALDAPLFSAPATRLLVDPNRSLGHRNLFSEWSRTLPVEERQRIVGQYWLPHRRSVEEAVRKAVRQGPVLHLSVHTFTPRWRGSVRPVDAALLYDPARNPERAFADSWVRELRSLRPDLRLRRNFPYRGTADGLTTHLRRHFAPGSYLGIEIEVSQRFPLGPARSWSELRSAIGTVLLAVLNA